MTRKNDPIVISEDSVFHLPLFLSAKEKSAADRHDSASGSIQSVESDQETIQKLQARIAELEHEREHMISGRDARQQLLWEGARLVSMGVWDFDVKSEKLYWSRGIYDIYGIEDRTIPPLEECLACYPPIDRKRVTEMLEQVTKTQKRRELECEFTSLKGEHKIVHLVARVGEVVDGQVTRIVGVVQDVTAKYRLQRGMQAFFRLTPDFVGAINKDLRPINLSPSWETALGWTSAELERESILRLLHPNDRERMRVMIEKAFQTEEMLQIENRVIAQSGQEHWVSWRLFGDQTMRTVFISAHDQTESKAAESALIDAKLEAEAASQAKTDFLAVMSHELRTPLNPILGFTDLLFEETENPQHKDLLKLMSQAGKNLNDVISDVLDFAKIEGGNLDVFKEQINLAELLHGCIAEIKDKVEEKSLILATELNVDTQQKYLGDEDKIIRVISNLLSNAVKFTDAGTIQLSCGLKPLDDGRSMLSVVVRDSGIGISEVGLKEVFSPFKQLDSSKTRRFGGTGLGLAICKKLVDFMGGSIEVESQLGAGSKFSLWLPLGVEEIEKLEGDDRRRVSATKSFSEVSPRVLLVEDNPTNAFYVKRVLTNLGCKVIPANSGEAALAQYSPESFDIVLLDLHMPGMGGVDVLRSIRKMEIDESLKRIPVLVLTADVMPSTKETCLSCGANGFLSKPVRPAELYGVLKQYFPVNQQ